MTKTNTTYKVPSIKPSQAEEKFKPKAQKLGGSGDAYKTGSSNAYKGLLDGKAKAEALNGGVLSEMAEAEASENSYERRTDSHSQMQDFLGNFMLGDSRSRPASDTQGNIPQVPDLQRDILDRTNLEENMGPVVARYAALEKTLIMLYDTARLAIHPRNMDSMSASELRSLQQYEDKLEDTLRECREQLADARELLRKHNTENESNMADVFIIPDLEL